MQLVPYLNMICCLARGVVFDQVLKAALQLSTACSISACVDCGTLVTTWLVAGLCTSIHLSVVDSTHWPLMMFCVVGGIFPPA